MMYPFISIIMPIRNEQKYIECALNSIVAQDYPSKWYEVLVVDGMSEDDTRSIVNKFTDKFDQIILIDNPQKYVPHALNIGLRRAKGEFIVRIDGHVVIAKDYLRQCVAYLQKTPADCVGGIIQSINGTFKGKAIALAMSSRFGVGNARFRTGTVNGKEGYVDALAFGAYRREVFDRIGLFDEELVRCQDDEFNYRLRKYGGKIFLTPKIKSCYFTRSSLKQLWRQYFQYGYWKIRVLQKHATMMQPRQFVPPLFVFCIGGSILLAPILKIAGTALSIILIVYLILSLVFSGILSYRLSLKHFFILPIIFFILHFSYGMGFLFGIYKLALKQNRTDHFTKIKEDNH